MMRQVLATAQHIAQSTATQLSAHLRILTVNLVGGHHAAGVPASRAQVIISLASAGLVANVVPTGILAARHRVGYEVQNRDS
jgi:hypothetical protein